jgi:hypothetical protein
MTRSEVAGLRDEMAKCEGGARFACIESAQSPAKRKRKRRTASSEDLNKKRYSRESTRDYCCAVAA